MNRNSIALLTTVLLGLAPAVLAHPVGHAHGGFAQGFLHPLLGADHVLAMLGVGLWASQQGSTRALWVIPAAFLAVMGLGFGLGLGSAPIPAIEFGILGSVLVIGLLVAFAKRLPLVAGAALAGLFAVFHGHAHGAEMVAGLSVAQFGLGFALACLVLLALGVFAGGRLDRAGTPERADRRLRGIPVVRAAGIMIVLAGGYLVIPG